MQPVISEEPSDAPQNLFTSHLSQYVIGGWILAMHAMICMRFREDPFDTPHARGTSSRGHERGTSWIRRLLCIGYASVHDYPFSFPSVPRPMGGRYFRVAYSVASVHSTRNLCCTRRISLATRNYKLIRNQHVSPSMMDETASSLLVLAKAIEFRCTTQKKYADWEYRIREDLNELSYCLAQNPLSWSLADHHNGLLRWRITA